MKYNTCKSRGNYGFTLPVFNSASIAWTVDIWFRNNCYSLNYLDVLQRKLVQSLIHLRSKLTSIFSGGNVLDIDLD